MSDDLTDGPEPEVRVDAASATPLTERERAIRALVSGAILGVALALLARRS